MKYKDFQQDVWRKIDEAIAAEVKSNPHPVAAFDADGTLWDTDLGEEFFHYQIATNALKLPPNPWEHYRKWKEKDPVPAYLWLAQINEGQKLEQVRLWAKENVKRMSPLPIYPAMQQLIAKLLDHKVKVYVVTASVKWAVEPGAEILGIPQNQVLGFQTEDVGGIITAKQKTSSTYREGKLKALLETTNGIKPFLAAGNTMGDFWLLQGASKLKLAVGSAVAGEELFDVEEKLRGEAVANNFMIHRFK